MPAHYGVDSPLIEAPDGGYAHESTREGNVEIVLTKNDQGLTVYADPRGHQKSTITVKGVGDADFSLLTSGDYDADEVKVTSVKRIEELGKRPTFEYSGVEYTNGVYTPAEGG